MTLREFMKGLDKFVAENPTALDLEVITSSDDEGNCYTPVVFEPSLGFYEDDDFIDKTMLNDWGRDDDDVNAVCIN